MKQPIRILIAETGELMCAGIKTMLKDQTDMVLLGEAKTKEEILCMCQYEPSLLLLTQNIPCPSLPALIAEIKALDPRVKLLILTSCQELAFVRATLQAGADGYALSDKSMATVLSAIRAVAEGEEWLSPSLGPKLQKGLDSSPPDINLTEQRLAILRLVGAGKNNKEIALIMQIGRRTVSYHLHQIYRALKVKSRAEAINRAHEMNLL